MDYKATLNLPKTDFPMKADLPRREPEVLVQWQAVDLYGQIRRARAGAEPFILHDGPPYANGDIHIGHALNKVLKDLIVRYKTMQGCDAPYVPGWDCHGMPIEHQLFKELKKTKHQIAQAEFREQARAYAQKYVDIQREQFKRLGVLGDWEHPYLTMSKDYELTILRVFKELVQRGSIYRGKKPVYWCATCETALAEAEVEYEDRSDTSIYVSFPIQQVAPRMALGPAWDQAEVVAWTTTPWTLPANVALCFHPEARYVVVPARSRRDGAERRLVLAANLAELLLAKLGLEPITTDRQEVDGKTLAGQLVGGERSLVCEGPFGKASVGVVDDMVSMTDGTGIVHIAPGHGEEDYLVGQRYGLEVSSPVDEHGRFTTDAPQPLVGLSVWEANAKIIEDLNRRGRLLHQEPITHSYPHCWRCKQPVITRATPQWFFRVDEALRRQLLERARQVRWIPEAGFSRMTGMLENRPDWCLSRQRYWGSPIPVFHCAQCGAPLLEAAVIERTIEALASRGVEAWFRETPDTLVPGAQCGCGSRELTKDPDILDVWFDSGVSHEAVLKTRQGLAWPAQLYLEGSDQHRGWFQVSLIPSVALHGAPPYEQVLTHGFVMDGEGRKMSKSLGNVVSPQDVLQRYGADILRLWVASCDYREDVRISEEILGRVAESYRKIRNTCRYLLANLYDFQPQRDRVPPIGWVELDRWASHRAGEVLEAVTRAYETYQFHDAARLIHQFCVFDLSAFYLDALKDRLYTEGASTVKRRCAQTALYDILGCLVRMLAPILVVTAEEIWQSMRAAGWVTEPSVHLARWSAAPEGRLDPQAQQRWARVLSMRDVVMKALEEQRGRGVIHSPLEAQVTLVADDQAFAQLCEASRELLAEAFVVSEVRVTREDSPLVASTEVPGLKGVIVERAPGGKCERCWKYALSVGAQAAHPSLCERCARVAEQMTCR